MSLDDGISNTSLNIPCGRNGLNVHVSQWNDSERCQCTLSENYIRECSAVYRLTWRDDEVAERLVKVSVNLPVNKAIRLNKFNDEIGSQWIVDLICT